MDWKNLQTYGQGDKRAFEVVCVQLFERDIRRQLGDTLVSFQVINSDGGDGGVEAIATDKYKKIYAVQAKFFLKRIEKGQLEQIRRSVNKSREVRSNIVEYTICFPSSLSDLIKHY